VTRKTLVLGAFATIVAVLLAIIGFRQDARIVETSAQTIRTEAPRDAVVSQKEQSSEIAEKRRLDAAVQRATLGAKTLKNATNNPDSFKLESALVIDDTGAVCYDFRAANAYGAIVKGQAVLSRDGKRFLADHDPGFARLWNTECAGKRGLDASAAIRWFAF